MTSGKSGDLNSREAILNIIVGGNPGQEGGEGSGLAPFFSLGTPEDLISSILDTSSNALDPVTAQANADVSGGEIHKIIKRAVLDTVKGAFTTQDLVRHIESQMAGTDNVAKDQLCRIISINGTQEIADKEFIGTTETINEMLNIDGGINTQKPTKDTPGLSSIMIHPVGISPCTRNTSVLSLFMNSIPAIEFARAMPYAELSLQVGRPALSADGRLNSPSLVKFIMGAATVDESDSGTHSMATAASVTDDEGNESLASAGMELFLSPQTLAPVGELGGFQDINAPTIRATDILDPFRPLMSLDSININVAATTGFMSFKTANVTLTVHDRSRLAEVADFIKPDLFSKTEFFLEYGWYHPMSSQNPHDYLQNPWGALLNAMRVKEKYGIVNSGFSMQDDGSVQVTLELAMKGMNEYRSNLIGSDIDVQNAAELVEALQEKVSELRNKISGKGPAQVRGTKGILGSQVLNSVQSTNGSPDLTKEQVRELKKVVSGAGSNNLGEDGKTLVKTIKELYGKNLSGDNGAIKRLKTSITATIEKKFKAIKDPDHGALIDPYYPDFLGFCTNTKFEYPPPNVTLGKVMMLFIGQPLCASKKFDDIQIIFYPFNGSAGKTRNKSVASFMIPKDELYAEFDTFVQERRGSGIAIGDFMNFITQTFLDNIASENYGMSGIYKKDPKTGKILPSVGGSKATQDARAATAAEQKMIDLGIPSGDFKMPQVDLHMETLPARIIEGSEGEDLHTADEKTILRIHVFDKAATAYETQGQLLAASRDSALGTISFADDPDETDLGNHIKRAQTYVNAGLKTGILEPIDGQKASDDSSEGPSYTHYRLAGGPRAVKEFVRSTVPNIIYGAQNTAVETLGLQSMQNPALSTVNMLRSDRAGSITPEGAGRGGLPLKTIPAELSVTTLGCPLLAFTQQFFVDAQTGTDLDNLYAITSLQHTIEAGSFKSAFQMTPLLGYGKYESTIDKTESALATLAEFIKEQD